MGGKHVVLRSFAAYDNEAFTIDPSSPSGSVGAAIINNSSTPVGRIFTFSNGYAYQTITVDDTSSEPDVFNDDEEDQHVITNGGTLVANGTQVESESYHYFRLLDDDGNPTGPLITITVFSKNGTTSDIWGMSSDTELIDGARYVKVGGSNNGDSLYDSFVPCFTPGTGLVSDKGERLVEDLRVGNRILTRENGMQPIRWIGTQTLMRPQMRAHQHPIRVRAGALGRGLPERDIIVSQNHRLLIVDPSLSVLFGESETLVAAKHLVGRPGIERLPVDRVTYIHVLFDHHEIVCSNGGWTESFQPGDHTMDSIGKDQRNEIYSLFPELRNRDHRAFTNARMILKKHEAAQLGQIV
jgi:hypothetical protein